MKPEDLGYRAEHEKFRKEQNLDHFEIGRVITEHKERYIVKTVNGDVEAEITGNLRFTAQSRQDFPAVGDWVALTVYDVHFAIIHHLFPRFSTISRQAVGKPDEIQIIAANIDVAFIIQAVDRDFNINRLERYLTICNTSKVESVIVLSKIDLISNSLLEDLVAQIKLRIPNIPILTISNANSQGLASIQEIIQKGKTYCLLGSSGVGKSTLINNLLGAGLMKTDHISVQTQRGRHVTSHRELIVLEQGGIIIDNPGMREVGIADHSQGIERTFFQIVQLSGNCKYADCTHTNEVGCAVIEAVELNLLDSDSYQNYLKMEREKSHYEASTLEKRKKDKAFGKMMKNYKKDRNSFTH
ncbi:MAG TPA: ribosome small subunit-dependent GTPase A [Marinilabiliales bacterium]|jgi:ribosome biogenesis GTPase|nr:MAG: ribosome small subunit-dependent GTPase A [Bacteroidetes bacterium GWA2_40_14]OFX58953.1 MAG: ribosome small subunit-dependent GTPase A [Bacteroidetes bacterium GWC2_40_13]OFX71323.1 MAG: ribosome small subunit-dependent GTPase A [Bacteroidetes bacterium GWD2_40_43]OFX91482.1 MAG: ribosome small subunit-dependent GTPase A [Bacteroidetes bacterium GWE2_40_63]OFY19551.1 MAG: ribosome small subunit-dependent GTPase A [Bacteroidetes bacterium GWF2_40_13]OFZ32184.1 MAG: ribosome small subun